MAEVVEEKIVPQPLEEEMKTSYLDYAMSVIIGRALPDVRDGLKPVHRRIIFTMKEMGLLSNRPYMKCARIVGDAMGKYHPHGDAAIYDALVRMAQDFSCRYTLVDGQGNFGSIDGDPPAAFRYTEARLAQIAEEMLTDIDKDTVNFQANYDGRNSEPVVLPAAIPNLLINGSSGIAVGMATNIPPHNLSETVEALIAYIDNPDIELKELMTYLPGPDFPTGGFIVGREGIADAYRTGRGKITLRANIITEQLRGGKEAIVVTEIPFQVNKSKLIDEIARLIQTKKVTAVSDLRDESDKEGIRIVMELKRGELAQVLINQLFKHTSLQVNFGIILLAIVNRRPRYLSLPRLFHHFTEHRKEVVVRRTRFDLEKAERRLHIVEGLKIAVDNIDAVINLIRASKSVDEARDGLMNKFELTTEQANAILDMRLQKLTGLERDKLLEEFAELKSRIKELRQILASPQKVLDIIKDELNKIKEKYGDQRQTQIIEKAEELTIEDLIAEERMVVTVSHQGYIKRTPITLYRKQRRGGKGMIGMDTKEEDWVEDLFVGTTHSHMLFFTNKGRCHWLKVYEIPQAGRASRGRPIVNLLQLQEGETVQAMILVRRFDDRHFLVMLTRRGMVVKNALSLYQNPRKTGINAIKITADDELIEVKLTNGRNELLIGTRYGLASRFHETEVRAMGRYVQGVTGIRLQQKDEVVGMEVCRRGSTILTVCERGYGKRTKIEEYRLTHRGAKGVINVRISEQNGNVVRVMDVGDTDELMIITQNGKIIRTTGSLIRVISRNTKGVRLIDLEKGDKVTAVARIKEGDEEATEAPELNNGIADSSQ